MALTDNRPNVDQLRRVLRGVVPVTEDDDLLGEQLTASIGWVQDTCFTRFNGRRILEQRDGNGKNAMTVKVGPITAVRQVKVELPVLALTRVYTDQEVKVYPRGRRIMVFTFKLAAEHASLHLDRQVYGNIFPPLPLCVEFDYCAGYPRYDPVENITSLDGSQGAPAPKQRLAGDQRDETDLMHLAQLQRAALYDAAATYAGTVARNQVGLVGSVSFDGFSKGLNPQAFGPAVEQWISDRDRIINRRRGTGMILSTTG